MKHFVKSARIILILAICIIFSSCGLIVVIPQSIPSSSSTQTYVTETVTVPVSSETSTAPSETSPAPSETSTAPSETSGEIPTSSPSTMQYTPKGFLIENIDGVTYIGGILIVNKTYPLPETYAPGALTNETYAAYADMYSAALADGITLRIISGYRSFYDQRWIYNEYVSEYSQEIADTFSARPGHSEHQSGLAMDMDPISDDFGNTPAGIWLAENCHKYGFIIRYEQGKEAITAYKYEPWHLRYVGKETASELKNSGLCLEEYLGITSKYAPEETN